MKPVQIDTEDFPSIIDTLKSRHKSNAYKIVGFLQLCVMKKRIGVCHTDRWPNFTTVILRLMDPMISCEGYSLISSDEQEAQKFLTSCPELISSDEDFIVFADIQPFLISTIRAILEPQGYDVDYEEPHVLLEAQTNDVLPCIPELPAGYRPCKLSLQHADIVGSTWFQVPSANQYLKHIIEQNQHVGLETESGELVGWMFEHTFGSQGVLHTVEKHRRKGLGRYLTISLRDSLLAMGKLSFMHVNRDNIASLKLGQSCGFKVVNDLGQDNAHIFISFVKKAHE